MVTIETATREQMKMWSLDLSHVLTDPEGRAAFRKFLGRNTTDLDCWEKMEEYRRKGERWEEVTQEMKDIATEVMESYMDENSPEPLPMTRDEYDEVVENVHRMEITPSYKDTFEKAQGAAERNLRYRYKLFNKKLSERL